MRWALAISLGLAATGCFDLPEVATQTCGNGILEPGEDCDRLPAAGHPADLQCTASCHYACTPGDPQPLCPAGWGCGIDQICRHGVATFAVEGPIELPTTSLDGEPLDDDGRIQAIGASNGILRVLRDRGGLQNSSLRVGDAGLFAAARLGGGTRASIVASGGLAAIGWNTTAEGRFRPLLSMDQIPADLDPTTPAIEVPEPGVRILPIHTDQSPDHEIALFALQASTGLMLGTLDPPTTRLITVRGELAQLAVPAIGNIDRIGNPGDELGVGFTGDTKAWVIRIDSQSCDPSVDTCSWRIGRRGETDTPSVVATIALPSGRRIADRLMFGDVDDDHAVDLLIILDNGETAVAHGNGSGGFGPAAIDDRFHPHASNTDLVLPLCAAGGSNLGMKIGNPPLLARDLDGDGRTDYVTADAIILSLGGGLYCRASFSSNATAAVALDANGDGRLDVALIDSSVAQIDTQSPNREFDVQLIEIPDGATPTTLEVAEVDGDYHDDVIVRAAGLMTSVPELWIAHGSQDIRTIEVSPGPNVGSASAIAAGAFQRIVGSSGGLEVFGHDALTDSDVTAQLQTTTGGLGSDFGFGPTSALAFDLQLGHFLANGPAGTFDLVALRGLHAQAPLIEVWPGQSDVLRHWGRRATALPEAARQNLRVYGDLDGDGLEELGYLDDQAAGTVLQRFTFAPGANAEDLALTPTLPISVGPFHHPVAAQLVDLDGDGTLELVAAFADGGVVIVRDLLTGPVTEVVTGDSAHGVLATNLDDDPELELVVVTDTVHLYDLAPTAHEIGGVSGVTTSTAFTGAITTSDLDGDGVRELIVGETAGTALVLWPATNTGPAR